jgi:hypothetical protein
MQGIFSFPHYKTDDDRVSRRRHGVESRKRSLPPQGEEELEREQKGRENMQKGSRRRKGGKNQDQGLFDDIFAII